MPSGDRLFDDVAINEDVKGKAMRGGVATGLSQVASLLITMASLPVLTRLLQQEDYGLISMVAVFTSLASVVVNSGITTATVQRESLDRKQASNLFWVATLVGFAAAVFVAACAPLVVAIYGESRLGGIMTALAAPIVFSGLTVQHQSLLRRSMRFGTLAWINMLSQTTGAVSAVLWAYCHYGTPDDYWALVLMPGASAAFRLVAVWSTCGWVPGPPSKDAGTRSLVAFGANLTGINLLHHLGRNLDRALIGYRCGGQEAGLYEISDRLFRVPASKVVSPVSGVAVPMLCRLAANPEAYRNGYQRLLELLITVGSPIAIFLGVTAHLSIPLYLGPDWGDIVPLTRWGAALAAIQPLTWTLSWLFVSQDKTEKLLKYSVAGHVILISAYFFGSYWGAYGVTVGLVLTSVFLRTPLFVYGATRTGPVRVELMLKTIAACGPLLLTVLIASIVGCSLTHEWGAAWAFVGTGVLALSCGYGVHSQTLTGRRLLKFLRKTAAPALARRQAVAGENRS